MKILYRLYHRVAHLRIIKLLTKIYRKGFFISNIKANKRLRELSQKKPHSGKIKVVFLGQTTTCWNKLKTIFETLKNDDRFKVLILALPDDVSKSNDGVYEYFVDECGSEFVIDAVADNSLFDLLKYQPDYVFYQRPYDAYLPKPYRSNIVSGYAKICYISYGPYLSEGMDEIALTKLFFRNTYMYFAENSFAYRFNVNRFKKSHKENYRKTYDLGYPSYEQFMDTGKSINDRKDNLFNVVWTPRWSEDKEVGGSNFIKFKDDVVKLPEINDRISLTFRPHPMTFSHFIEIGKMTEDDVKQYCKLYMDNPRMHYDNAPDFARTFWNSDVLLTDISAVIYEYLLTEKPIVYCETYAKPNAFFAKLKEGMYCVETWDEAVKALLDLEKGIDPLKEKRIRIKDTMFGTDFSGVSKRIVEEIVRDFGMK